MVLRDNGARGAGLLRRALGELAGLALPTSCAGCGAPGDPWCAGCASRLAADGAGWPRPVAPDPTPPGCPPVCASGPYEGPLRGALVAFKDGGRRDVACVLAPLLAASLTAALGGDSGVVSALHRGGPVWLVPVPSSSAAVRARGDVPLDLLLMKAIHDSHLVTTSGLDARSVGVARCLRLTRRVADQAGLGSGERAANLDRAMAVRGRWGSCLAGSVCVLVDDVLTTGATLTEAARALRAGGAQHVVGATVAATRRRRGHPNG